MSTQAASDGIERDRQDALKVNSAALARLIEEVRNNRVSAPTAYNRMHNRHNR